ncbi:hypothetical protein HAX54_010504 [Datura stramonium]|uniref:Uncharacterized protein n=1 Tax=Datura stramonium TaxID=4076 RepID=A0ABS8TGC6_DATST|nr:hypothetical protein [Datura stramonium]
MTCFNNREMPYPCLEIVNNEQNSRAKALNLKVHPLDDAPSSTKEGQPQLNGQGKLSHSSKSKVILSNPIQTVKVASHPKHLFSLNEDVITSATSSSNERKVSQEQRWKCLKRKAKDLSDQHSEFTDLDSISIDTAIFEDSATGSIMLLTELAHQKITRDSHQEILSNAQQHLHTANKEKIKVDKHLGELQKVLARGEKELEAWTSKKKKTLSLIKEHRKKFSKNQECITNSEDGIHAFKKISPLSETYIKKLTKLKEDAKTSRHQILSHKLFS